MSAYTEVLGFHIAGQDLGTSEAPMHVLAGVARVPVFGLLMFPWPASHRAIRTHGFVAIVGYLLVLGKILVTVR